MIVGTLILLPPPQVGLEFGRNSLTLIQMLQNVLWDELRTFVTVRTFKSEVQSVHRDELPWLLTLFGALVVLRLPNAGAFEAVHGFADRTADWVGGHIQADHAALIVKVLLANWGIQ